MSSPVAADIGRIRRSQSETAVLIDENGQRLAKCETQKQRADSKTWADDMLGVNMEALAGQSQGGSRDSALRTETNGLTAGLPLEDISDCRR